MATAKGTARLVSERLLALPPKEACSSLLVLVEVANHSTAMLSELRKSLAVEMETMHVVSAIEVYSGSPSVYTSRVLNFEATFAEKEVCSHANVFFGDQRSTFSAHVAALGEARASRIGDARKPTFEKHLSRSGPCYLKEVYDGEGLWCYA